VDALQRIVFAAGQKVHEQLYGASLNLFDADIPCDCSEVVNDFELIPGGKSPATYVQTLTFHADHLPDSRLPAKGVRCTLLLNPEAAPLKMMLWHGGLLPDGFTYQFMAVDANYHA